MKTKVSIIIPVYKVEDYIEDCLKSVYEQEYPFLEIIIVNDSTPDRSFDMAKIFIGKQTRQFDVIFIELDTNRGLSAARNAGIKVASGDYLFFLDSDDLLCPNSISNLVSICEKYPGIDMVQGNFRYLGFSEIEFIKFDFVEYTDDKKWIKKNYLGQLFGNDVHVPRAVWNKLIRRDMVINNGMWFKEGVIFEDNHWRMVYYRHIKNMAFCRDITYVYRYRPTSITHNYTEQQKWDFYIATFRDFLPLIESDDEATNYLLFIQMLDFMSDSCNKQIVKDFCRSLSMILKNPTVNIQGPRRVLLYVIGYTLKIFSPFCVKRMLQVMHLIQYGTINAYS